MVSDEPYTEADVARQLMLIWTRISVPVQPRPFEGLADILFRAACLNGYRSSSILGQALGVRAGAGMSPEALAAANLSPVKVANLLGCRRPTDVLGLMNPIQDVPRSRIKFFGREVVLDGFFASHRRLAPNSLKGERYQRAVWSVGGLGFDPDTRELLLSKCPMCGAKFPYESAVDIGTCAKCLAHGRSVDLAAYPQPKAVAGDEEALLFALNLINPRIAVEEADLGLLHKDLAGVGPGIIFQLIVGLARCRELGSSNIQFQVAPSADALARASRAVLSWPKGMQEFMEEIIRERGIREDPWTLSRSACRGLGPSLQAIVYHVCHGKRHVRRKPSRWLTNVASQEGVAEVRHSNGMVSEIEQKVENLAVRWGVARPFVTQIFGVISGDEGSGPPQLLEASAKALEVELASASLNRARPSFVATLRQAVAALGGVGTNPWPIVLSAVREGRIEAWLQEDEELPLIERLLVSDFLNLRSIMATVGPGEHLAQHPVDLHGLAAIMGLTSAKCAQWRRGGILPGKPTLDDAWKAHGKFISTGEILLRLCTGAQIGPDLREVNRSLTAAGIVPIGRGARGSLIHLYRRSDAEAAFRSQLVLRITA